MTMLAIEKHPGSLNGLGFINAKSNYGAKGDAKERMQRVADRPGFPAWGKVGG